MESIYFEITVIICLSAVLSIVFRYLKQPFILAYILTGIILNYFGLVRVHNQEALQSLGQLGITFLLFMLGLELKLKELRSIGLPAIIIGSLQMWFTFVLGFFLAYFLGFSQLPAVYLGIALSFSSTMLVVKNLSDRKDINSLHGKLSIGLLLIQDFFAVFALLILSSIKPGVEASFLASLVGIILLKAGVLIVITLIASVYILPKIVHSIARSSESLFLFSLAWVFALTALVTSPWIGFSIEIGGYLAGLSLANCAENFHIVTKMKALRDFFLTIFYVMLGLSMSFANIGAVIPVAILFFLFVAVIKPILIVLFVGMVGYKKRTAFLVGSSMGQISEFSFILVFLGNNLGLISTETVTMILLVGMAGFLGSTFAMKHNNGLYKRLEGVLGYIEPEHARKNTLAAPEFDNLKRHLVIVGGHQMGQSILHAMEESKEKIVVIDFDPDIIKKLEQTEALVLFGDIADPDIHAKAHFDTAKLVISTVPDVEDNLILLRGIHHDNRKAKIVVMALENEDARELYKAGADYVILPHLTGGRFLAKLIKEGNLESVEWHKQRDMAYIS
jgi:Kef-type K+ transport system membrane component KefB